MSRGARGFDILPDGWIGCAFPPDPWALLPHEATTSDEWGAGLQCGLCLRPAAGHDEAVAAKFRATALGWRHESTEATGRAVAGEAWAAAYRRHRQKLLNDA